MVLQRSPAKAAVFGVLPANTTAGPVTVKVSGGGTDYSVTGTAAEDGTWKVGDPWYWRERKCWCTIAATFRLV
jgi:hypothetical protein